MYGRFKLLLAAIALILFAVACGQSSQGGSQSGETTGSEANAKFPVTITDSLGRKVRITKEPQEISSMAPSVTETVYLVGAGKKVAGVTTVDDYPPQVKKVEKIGNFTQVNAEKVASVGTDVLFLSYDSTTKAQANDLEKKTGAKTVVINPTTVKQAIESVGTVGKIVGKEKKAQATEDRLKDRLAKIRSAVRGKPKPTVFYELGYDPLYTVGPGSFINDAIEIAGGKNVTASTGQAYPQYSTEKLLKDDPKYYLVGSSTGNTAKAVEARKTYSSLSAVKNDRVFVMNDDLISRPGPRIVKGVREIAETIHPDAFK